MDCTKMEQFWDDQPSSGHGHGPSNGHSGHGSAYERNLNFSTVAVEDGEYGFPKKKTVRDPLSHRIIEKRRRDRMNNCLADLARLLPPSSLRKGRGRIEKTEIVELAIKHLKHLQCHPCPHSDNCEYNQIPMPRATQSKSSSGGSPASSSCSGGTTSTAGQNQSAGGGETHGAEEEFRLGYQESTSETMHFLVEKEGMYPGDGLCVRLVQHLNSHCDNLLRDDIGNNRKLTLGLSVSTSRTQSLGNNKKSSSANSGSSISSGYQPNGSSGSGSDGNGTNGSNPKSGSSSHPSGVTADSGNMFDLEGDQNSCSSAPLSLDITDTFSIEGGKTTGRSQSKPPIPTIICSHSSSTTSCTCKLTISSGSPPVHMASSSNSDESGSGGGGGGGAHRYKFKNNIKQRFSAQADGCVEDDGQGDADLLEKPIIVSSKSSRKQHDSHYKSLKSKSNNTSLSLAEIDSPSPAAPDDAELCIDADEQVSLSRKRRSSLISIDGDLCETSDGLKRDLKNTIVKGTEFVPLDEMLMKVATTVASVFPSPILTAAGHLAAGELIAPGIKILTAAAPKTPGSMEEEEHLDQKPLTLPIVATVSDGKLSALCPPKGIPAFALHEKGLFYIPLTIDPAILSPFIAAMDPSSSAPPLHPVTISVCFLLDSAPKKLSEFPPSPSIPMASLPTSIRTRVLPDIVSVDLSKSSASRHLPSHHQPHHHHHHHVSKRESREFIMNRFAQSQVPMIFGPPIPGQEYHPQQQFSQMESINSLSGGSTGNNRLYPPIVAATGRGGSISSSSSSSQQSSTYFNPTHKQHSPGGHSNRSSTALTSSDPSLMYHHHHHPGQITSNSTTTHYPNSRSTPGEVSNNNNSPPSSSGSSSSRNRQVSGNANNGSHSTSHSSHSSSSANRKRSISISPSVSSGYMSWDGKPGKSSLGDSVYGEHTYVSGTLGDDHTSGPARQTPRSYITSGGGPMVYPQPIHPHNNPDHYDERHHEGQTTTKHRSNYPNAQFYPENTETQERGDRSSGGQSSSKRAKKSRESSIGEAGHTNSSSYCQSSAQLSASRHTTP